MLLDPFCFSTMKRRISLPVMLGLPLIMLQSMTFGQDYPPSNLNSEALRSWLKSEWYDPYFDDLGYNGARTQMFGYTDESEGIISCIYTGFQQSALFTTYLDPINTEHIIPQSFFGSLSPMKSDLFNIRPTHGSANSARGNSPYAEVADENAQWYGTDAAGNYVTQGNIPTDAENWSERSGDQWEPQESVKGDIARKVFYFYTMYPTQAGAMSLLGDPEMFRSWHLNDPVDDFESTRNQRVMEVQGNFNPFISHPDLVEIAWFWEGETVLGCTDLNACNYDVVANSDDGSCIFPESGLDCDGNPLVACSLFFSEYAEGSSFNKYLEIYNPGLEPISLEGYALAHTVNEPAVAGEYETWVELPVTAWVEPGAVFRIVHPSADPSLVNTADFTYSGLSNGDDGFGLVIGSPTDYEILDMVGDWLGDPGTGWSVAGTTNATANHTLVRKPEVLDGNDGEWLISAGTNSEDSEWIVLDNDNWSNYGSHSADGSCDAGNTNDGDLIVGCTYPSACNYNSVADDDDGSCDFVTCEILGCSYPNALNFNDLSTIDDGSCLFLIGDTTCPSDINQDGLISVGDLLLLLSDFGGACIE